MQKRSLLWRVTTLAVAIAGLTSGSVALVSTLLSDHLILRAEDKWLSETAAALVAELPRGDAQHWLREETNEFAPAGVVLALFRDGTSLMPTTLPKPTVVDGCSTLGAWRLCARARDTDTLVVAKAQEKMTTHRQAFFFSSVLAMVLTMGCAALFIKRAAKWAVSFEEELAQTRRFASNAAHEMRTPLATLNAEIELLRESQTLKDVEQHALTRVHTTVGRLKNLIERLLVLATVPPSSAVFHEHVSLSELIERTLSTLPADAARRVSAQCNNELLTVRGDFELLSLLLGNAVDNALKFSGSEPVEIRVEEDAIHVRVLIADNGPGIAEEDRARVFEAFYRSASARASQVGGHGIGLALIAHISKLHGGDAAFIGASRGARLCVTLPKA